MRKLFPTRFDPTKLLGARGAQHVLPYDAFQELVVDGLREHFGPRVQSSPTLGRDGGIDAWIGDGPPLQGAWESLPAPVIVECKHHDAPTWANIKRTCKETCEAIRRRLGQPLSDEWAACRAYAYCVSAALSVPQSRALASLLHAALSARDSGTVVRVLTWAELRYWLNQRVQTRDHWLGLGSPALMPHREYVTTLQRVNAYLLEERLPFVEPERDSPAHPDTLVARLRAFPKPILVTGVGGIGKSRTLLEVATRLAGDGWRVLHVLGQATVEPAEIADEALAASPTLLVVDYLDRVGLEPLELDNLVREAASGGSRLAIIASARVSWASRLDPENEAMLHRTDVTVSPQRRLAIAAQIRSVIAPRAMTLLGPELLGRICGERPIITLLIASEVERRVVAGESNFDAEGATLAGDITHWLRRRLADDQLSVPRAGPWESDTVSAGLVSAAAILGAAPASRERLQLIGLAALQSQPSADSRWAARIIANLEGLGWLELDGEILRSAHDVVVDEILTDVLRERDTRRLRDECMRTILESWTADADTFVRSWLILGRVLDARQEDAQFVQDATQFATAWMAADAGRIVLLMGRTRAREMANLVEAVGRKGWSSKHPEFVETLVRAWMGPNGRQLGAWRVLGRAVELAPLGRAESHVREALSWLGSPVAQRRYGGAVLLRQCLQRSDLPADIRQHCRNLTLDWLADRGRRRRDLSQVATPLLRSTELSDKERDRVEAAAVEQLDLEGFSHGSFFILASLIEHGRLPARRLAAFIRDALRLLDETGPSAVGSWDLAEALQAPRVYPLCWQLSDSPHLMPLLVNQLARRSLGGEDLERLVSLCLAWCELDVAPESTSKVLTSLLKRDDLPESTRPLVVARAMQWIDDKRWASTPLREVSECFVLRWLLRKSRPVPDELFPRVAQQALEWIERNLHGPLVSYVVGRLLRDERCPPDVLSRMRPLAVAWLDGTDTSIARTWVVDALLRDPELDEATRSRLAAIPRLERPPVTIGNPKWWATRRLERQAVPTRNPKRRAPVDSSYVEDGPLLGHVLDVVVKSVVDYGAFVSAGRVGGMLHRLDIDWGPPPQRVGEKLMVGDSLRVRVLSGAGPGTKYSFGARQLDQDIWNGVRERVRLGSVVTAPIAAKSSSGAHVVDDRGVRHFFRAAETTLKALSIGSLVHVRVVGFDDMTCNVTCSLDDGQFSGTVAAS